MKFISRLLIIFFSISTFVCAYAAYLRNVPQQIIQPDGTIIHCFATGDEFHNWLHDSNKFTIIRDPATGYFVYAIMKEGKLSPSEYIVGKNDPLGLGLTVGVNISPEEILEKRKSFNRTMAFKSSNPSLNIGSINNIVIFIRFLDQAEYTQSITTYNVAFNNISGISMNNYFREVSSNQLNINSTFYPSPGAVVISYQDSHNRDYYLPFDATTNPNGYTGGDDGDERTNREHTLLRDAAESCKAQIESSGLDFDQDNDGYVDNVCFVVKGNTSAWSSLLWPHRWSLYSYNIRINGSSVGNYNFQISNSFGVGVLCHEMFHTLGAPDLYHYSQDGFSPVGPWDIMGSTTYPPQHMGAYMKRVYGNWSSTIPEITTEGDYSLSPLSTSPNQCYSISSPNSSSEYFILEYRKKEGTFESGIVGSGLIIYRISSSGGRGNANGPPDEIYAYRPGGTTVDDGDVYSANFSANTGRTSFDNTTDPRCFLSNNGDAGISISNISTAGSSIDFHVSFPAPIVFNPPRNLSYIVNYIDVELSWELPEDNGNTLSGFDIYRNSSLIFSISDPAQLNYTDPNLPDDNYNYYITAKYSSPVGVSDHSNHVDVVISSALPDYIIENVLVSPNPVMAGFVMDISCDVRNNGTASGDISNLIYYLSVDDLYDAGDAALASDAVPSLDIGNSSSQTERIRIDAGSTPGSYYILFMADADSNVNEENENNNLSSIQFDIIEAKPDLIISHTNVDPVLVNNGGTIISECDVDNISGVNADASILKFYLSDDITLSGEDLFLDSEPVPEISAYSSVFVDGSLIIPADFPAGFWYVLFYADADEDIDETDETNNTGFFQIEVEIAVPDLVLDSPVVTPDVLFVGDNIQTNVNVTNQASVSSPISSIDYFLSNDQTYDPSDVLLGNKTVNILGPFLSEIYSSILSIPMNTIPGNWYIIFYIDRNELIDEITETNNQVFKSIQLSPALPDLSVIQPLVSPAQIFQGAEFELSCDIINSGPVLAAESNLKYFYSDDLELLSDDILLGNNLAGIIQAFFQNSVISTLTLPYDIQEGFAYIFFYCDADEQVAESDENNNQGFFRIEVLKTLPDLTLSNLIVSPMVLPAGNDVDISIDINNVINVPAGAGPVKFYLSDNESFDLSNQLIETISHTEFTGSGTQTINLVLNIPELTDTGNKYLILMVDPGNLIEESEEDNNFISAIIKIEDRSGINNNRFNNILVYPNPNTGQFYINNIEPNSEKIQIKVLNMFGSLVYNKTIYPGNVGLSEEINIRTESKGVYIIYISSGFDKFIRKIIIK